jgi:hypothetical protein
MLVACSHETKSGVVETSSGINDFTKIDSDVILSYASSDDVVLLPENISGSFLDDNYTDIHEIPILPNLKPGWLWDTDGPIILSTKPDTSFDEILIVGSNVFADIIVFNGSLISVESGFSVDIFFDNQKIYKIHFTGSTPGAGFRRSIDVMSEIIDSLNVTSGEHIVGIHIDPDNQIEEFDENDNVFEKIFVWSDYQVDMKFDINYSDDDLKTILSKVPKLLKSNRPVIGEVGSLDIDEILNIADAGIFLLTGSSVMDKRIRIQILSRQDYLNRLDIIFKDMLALNDGSDYLAFHQEIGFQKKYSLGKKDRIDGMVDVMVDGSNTFDLVIGTLVHELAHALQDLLAPIQTEGSTPTNSLELMVIREAEAQQFERAFWLAIQEVTGEDLFSFRYNKSRDEYINFNTYIDSNEGYYQHDLGRLIQWLAVLSDKNLENLKIELLKNGELSYKSGISLFEYFLTIEPDDVSDYVVNLLASFDYYDSEIIRLQKGRLTTNGNAVEFEYKGLEKVSLLMP